MVKPKPASIKITTMEKSDSIKEIADALKLFQATVGNVTKDGVNPFFKSKYATLENVITTVKEHLVVNGLSYAQFPDGDGLYTIILHKSGEWIGAHATLELKGHTPQDQGSAITYMRRYALSAALGLATEEDDDGNAASKPAAKPVIAKEKQIAANNPVWKKPTLSEKKARIKQLIDGRVLQPLAQTAEAYENYVFANFGFTLNADNYDEIIKALNE